jgi:hypothetical protein
MITKLTILLFLSSAFAVPNLQGRTKRGADDTVIELLAGANATSSDVEGCFLVAFGDSMTDNGVGHDDPYGFYRYCNGDNWPDYLQRLLGCRKLLNTAYGGATSGTRNVLFKAEGFGIAQSVDMFLKEYPTLPDNLVVGFQFGAANDLGLGIGMDEIVTNNNASLRKLAKAGARKIIAIGLHDGAPYSGAIRSHGMQDGMKKLVAALHKPFQQMIDELSQEYPDGRFAYAPETGIWEWMNANLDFPLEMFDTAGRDSIEFGIWNEYGWYDNAHPTSIVQKQLALRAYEAWKNAA